MGRIELNKNVLELAVERISKSFDIFSKICISFSGGKDSTVLLHLAATEARKRKRKISVLFVDWEAQFESTIEHIISMKKLYSDCIDNFYWVALPLSTPSGVSQFQNHWICWEPGVEWVRMPPQEAITDVQYFPFYRYGMTFEEFIPAFNTWFCRKSIAGVMVGIRADESLFRFMAITSKTKISYADDMPWTTASSNGFYYLLYPLYDWKVSDVWAYVSKYKMPYNRLYNYMYKANVAWGAMRVCEPFGPEQRKGLYLYHHLEPSTWDKVCYRVQGALSGAIYAGEPFFYARNKISKPEHHTWKSYALFLLRTMPTRTSEHYRTKISIYLHWYENKGISSIPDEQPHDMGTKDIPSWRRICKVILKHDYWCRMLSFSPTKMHAYQKPPMRVEKKKEIKYGHQKNKIVDRSTGL